MPTRWHARHPFWFGLGPPTGADELRGSVDQSVWKVAIALAVAHKVSETVIPPVTKHASLLCLTCDCNPAVLVLERRSRGPHFSWLDRLVQAFQKSCRLRREVLRICGAEPFPSTVCAFATTRRIRIVQFLRQELHQASRGRQIGVHARLL